MKNTKLRWFLINLVAYCISYLVVDAFAGPVLGTTAAVQLEDSTAAYAASTSLRLILALSPTVFLIYPLYVVIKATLNTNKNP